MVEHHISILMVLKPKKYSLKQGYKVPPRRLIPHFVVAKKVPHDPGSRDRALFALWSDIDFLFEGYMNQYANITETNG